MSDWLAAAACRGTDHRLFFPVLEHRPVGETAERLALARSICDRCPVAAECLTDALVSRDFDGIRAGLTGAQRKRLPRPPRRLWCPECGTQFETSSGSNRKYCGVACRRAAINRQERVGA